MVFAGSINVFQLMSLPKLSFILSGTKLELWRGCELSRNQFNSKLRTVKTKLVRIGEDSDLSQDGIPSSLDRVRGHAAFRGQSPAALAALSTQGKPSKKPDKLGGIV